MRKLLAVLALLASACGTARAWVRDAQFGITHLGAHEVGSLGHSYGGSSAVLTAVRDHRVRAVCNLDGRMLDPIEKPVRLDVQVRERLHEAGVVSATDRSNDE